MQKDISHGITSLSVFFLEKGKKTADQYGSQALSTHGGQDFDLMKAKDVPGDRGGAAGADDIQGNRAGVAGAGNRQTPKRIFRENIIRGQQIPCLVACRKTGRGKGQRKTAFHLQLLAEKLSAQSIYDSEGICAAFGNRKQQILLFAVL